MSVLKVLLLLIVFHASVGEAQSPRWQLGGNPADSALYRVVGDGNVMNAPNASFTVQSVKAVSSKHMVAFNLLLSADTLTSRRLTFSADIKTSEATDGAFLSAIVAGASGALASLNTRQSAVKGTTDWTRQEISVRIDPRATRLGLGLVVMGGGSVEMRNVRVVAQPLSATSASAQRYLDSAIAIVKNVAYWSDTVTWSQVESDVHSIARGAQTAADVYPAIQHLLQRLGDHHSFFRAPSLPGPPRGAAAAAPPFAPVEARVVPGNVGLIQMPGFASTDSTVGRRYAAELHAKLLAVRSDASCGWIVDLRENTGGNMWPMLAGLQPLLGDVVLGTFRSRRGVSSAPWRARRVSGDVLPAGLTGLDSVPVAVLYGPKTASSGEAVAIAFRGRVHSRSFGEPTYGLSNGNSSIRLEDGAMLYVMSSLDVDRNGVVYGAKLEPDQRTLAKTSDADPPADAARDWLRQSCTTR